MRNAHLLNLQVGIRGYDSAAGEVHSLAGQVPAEASLLALQTLHQPATGFLRLSNTEIFILLQIDLY